MRKFWRLPMVFFVVGATAQGILCFIWASTEPADWWLWSFRVVRTSIDAAFFVVNLLPITHSHYGWNTLEARIGDGVMVVSSGLQLALVGVVIEAVGIRMKKYWAARRKK